MSIPNIYRFCSCGRFFLSLPEKHTVMDQGSVFDGIWFNCESCHSTMWIAKSSAMKVSMFSRVNNIGIKKCWAISIHLPQ